MPDLSVRSSETELMDNLSCSGEVVSQTLKELEFINQWLGGNAVTIGALRRLLSNWPRGKLLHIADLGCGGGDMLRVIAAVTGRMGIPTQLTGIDANPEIVDYARKNLADLSNAQILNTDILSDEFRSMQFDVVIGTLFFHHFDGDTLTAFFQKLRSRVRVGIIINDIHRHFIAYHAIHYLTKAFSRSVMVRHDAPLSVARAFSRADLEQILRNAGLENYQIRWKWAFRWQVVVRTS